MNQFINIGRFCFVEFVTNDIKCGLIGRPLYFKGMKMHQPRPRVPKTNAPIPVIFDKEDDIRQWVVNEFPHYTAVPETKIRGIERYYRHPIDFWVARYVRMREEEVPEPLIKARIREEASRETRAIQFEQFVQAEQAGELGVPWADQKAKLMAYFKPGEEHFRLQKERNKEIRIERLREIVKRVLPPEVETYESPSVGSGAVGFMEAKDGAHVTWLGRKVDGLAEVGEKEATNELNDLKSIQSKLLEEAAEKDRELEARRAAFSIDDGDMEVEDTPKYSPFDLPLGMRRREFEDFLKDFPEVVKHFDFYDPEDNSPVCPFTMQMYNAGNSANPLSWPDELQDKLVENILEAETFKDAQDAFNIMKYKAEKYRRENPAAFSELPTDSASHPLDSFRDLEIARRMAKSIKTEVVDDYIPEMHIDEDDPDIVNEALLDPSLESEDLEEAEEAREEVRANARRKLREGTWEKPDDDSGDWEALQRQVEEIQKLRKERLRQIWAQKLENDAKKASPK